ncbi:MAG: hypothetical protein Q9207_005126 [Kuettlingeria erythrocarpa]
MRDSSLAAQAHLILPLAGKPSNAPDADHGNFFKATTYDEAYWDDYMAARAKYSSDFYDRIFAYYNAHHDASSQTQAVAHDIGTGPGQVAAELCAHFNTVIASDTNSTHLAVAAARLARAGLKDRVTWTPSGAEDLANQYPPASASLLTVAECLPLLDVPRAMTTFAHLLQPQGTLAVWFYGRPAFSEPEFAATCQPILNEILDLTFEKAIKGSSPVHKAAWKSAADTLESFLDDVHLSPDVWRDVYRYKWNPHLPMPVSGPNACDYPIEPSSNIDTETETVVEQKDPQFWAESWDVDEVRRFVECLIPVFAEKKANGEYEHVEPKYLALERAMGGKEAKRAFTWPVVLILATRK